MDTNETDEKKKRNSSPPGGPKRDAKLQSLSTLIATGLSILAFLVVTCETIHLQKAEKQQEVATSKMAAKAEELIARNAKTRERLAAYAEGIRRDKESQSKAQADAQAKAQRIDALMGRVRDAERRLKLFEASSIAISGYGEALKARMSLPYHHEVVEAYAALENETKK